MKVFRCLLPFLVLVALLAIVSSHASAAWGWFSCTVDSVGSSLHGFEVVLSSTDAAFSGTKTLKFHTKVTQDRQKEIIATLLTAKSMSKDVLVLFETNNTFTLQGAMIK